MVFNKKGFFLELGDGSSSESPAVSIPVREIEANDEASTADAQQPVALAVSKGDSTPAAASDSAVSPAASPKETAAAKPAGKENWGRIYSKRIRLPLRWLNEAASGKLGVFYRRFPVYRPDWRFVVTFDACLTGGGAT